MKTRMAEQKTISDEVLLKHQRASRPSAQAITGLLCWRVFTTGLLSAPGTCQVRKRIPVLFGPKLTVEIPIIINFSTNPSNSALHSCKTREGG